MSNVIKPPLPATLASPTQSTQMSTTFGHNFGGTMPPSFQSLNNVPYGMLTPIPQFNTQQQQEHIQQHMPPLLPAPMSIPPPPPTQTQHQSSVISPGWNDPPILTTDKPRQVCCVITSDINFVVIVDSHFVWSLALYYILIVE